MNLNSQLISKLASLHDTQFTGIVTLTTKNAQAWNIYLYLGQLLWTESRIHRNRFWQRNLSKLCSVVPTTKPLFESPNNHHISDYYLINTLREKKLVTREKIRELINRRVLDTFGEIFQAEARDTASFRVTAHPPLFLL